MIRPTPWFDQWRSIQRRGSNLPSRNWYQFADPERIAGLVSPGHVERHRESNQVHPDWESGELTIDSELTMSAHVLALYDGTTARCYVGTFLFKAYVLVDTTRRLVQFHVCWVCELSIAKMEVAINSYLIPIWCLMTNQYITPCPVPARELTVSVSCN